MPYLIEITSPCDREYLVAEIWREDVMVAEVNQEDNNMNLIIYCNGGVMSLNYEGFLEIIIEAKKLLRPS